MVKKPRKKAKKVPVAPTLVDVLHDLENIEDGNQVNSAIPTGIDISALTRLGLDPSNQPTRSTDPFWREFMQNLKDLERLKIIETEIYNIRTRLAMERQDVANYNEQLRQDIENQRKALPTNPK